MCHNPKIHKVLTPGRPSPERVPWQQSRSLKKKSQDEAAERKGNEPVTVSVRHTCLFAYIRLLEVMACMSETKQNCACQPTGELRRTSGLDTSEKTQMYMYIELIRPLITSCLLILTGLSRRDPSNARKRNDATLDRDQMPGGTIPTRID